ncbi:MAG: hypothetical protein H0U75_07390 [Legionella sp.]|nr:hypothetical protein [Legionella sp.]
MKIRLTLISAMALSALSLTGCSSADMNAMVSNGDAVSTTGKHLKPTRSEQIKVFSQADIPKHYQVIGRVSAENYTMVGMTISQASILAELKKQAASLGAVGIASISTGLTKTTAEAIVI